MASHTAHVGPDTHSQIDAFHTLSLTNTPFPDQSAGLGDHNFCRNPDGTVNPRPGASSVWCFTTDPNKEWDFCDPCGKLQDHRNIAHPFLLERGLVLPSLVDSPRSATGTRSPPHNFSKTHTRTYTTHSICGQQHHYNDNNEYHHNHDNREPDSAFLCHCGT